MTETILWSPGMTLEAVEKDVIVRAYRHYKGNKTATSQSLGISIRTLDHKLERYVQDERRIEEQQEQRRQERAQQLDRSRGFVPQPSPFLSSADARLRMESFASAPSEPAVPMPERKEVQAMSPAPAPKGAARKAR